MFKNKVTVVENNMNLIGTQIIGGPSILVGIRVFELGRLGGSSDTPMRLGFKTAGETKANLVRELGGSDPRLDHLYISKMEPYKHTMLFKWYPAEVVTYIDNIKELGELIDELQNEIQ